METHEELKQRVRLQRQLIARLRLATNRLEEAQRERIWAIAAASEEGLSIRQIGSATGLSPTRVQSIAQSHPQKFSRPHRYLSLSSGSLASSLGHGLSGVGATSTSLIFLTYDTCAKQAIAPLTCSSPTAKYSSNTSRLR